MGVDTMRSRLESQQGRLRKLVIRAAEFLCAEGRSRLGSWGDTRTSSSAIWALADCGIRHTHPDFTKYTTDRLLASDTAEKTRDKLSFNWEVWDTSIALIAIAKVGGREFTDEIAKAKHWLIGEALDDNFNAEPWDTLWAVNALLAVDDREVGPLVNRCLSWVLKRRNARGVLISSHYMGFLLMSLAEVMRSVDVKATERRVYRQAMVSCVGHLMAEFRRGQRKDRLWDNEPWIVGHVLLGIASAVDVAEVFLRNNEFNDYLINWYEAQEWLPGRGWDDLSETSFALVGLGNYYLEREAHVRGGMRRIREDIRRELASEVKFKFDPSKVSGESMTIRPRWRGRDFRLDADLCFVLMPFREKWSAGLRVLLDEILRTKGLDVRRADDMKKPDILEDIWKGMNEARIIIAECTGNNPNVFYELGMAHTIGKDVIILTQDYGTLPFDIRHLRAMAYTADDDGFRKLRQVLPEVIDDILRN